MSEEQTGFFGGFYKLVEQINKKLDESGKSELSSKLSESIKQIEALVKNLNDALYNSYKLSYNIIETECRLPDETKNDLKVNLKKLIDIYEKG